MNTGTFFRIPTPDLRKEESRGGVGLSASIYLANSTIDGVHGPSK